MKAVLTIAGSDSSGGAGIQADLKTIAAHGLFGMSAITSLTAQNTTGVFGVENVSPQFVAQQIDVVFDDIRPDAVKVGMVSSPEIVEAIADALQRNAAGNVVVDPVMVATSGSALIVDEAVSALVERLFPLASVVTPNLSEAEVLAGFPIDDAAAAERAAGVIKGSCGGAVLIKGGHGLLSPMRKPGDEVSDDLLVDEDGTRMWFQGSRVDTCNTHGTGCTLSSAIACELAEGQCVIGAVRHAKEYINGALRAGLDLGRGSGPLDHMWMYR